MVGGSFAYTVQPTLFSEDLTNDLSAIPISEGKTAKAKSVTSKGSYQS